MTAWVPLPLSQNRFQTHCEALNGLTYIDWPQAFVLVIGGDNYKVETILANREAALQANWDATAIAREWKSAVLEQAHRDE